MKANKLAFAAMLAGAGVASIGTLAEDKGVMHKMTPATEMPAKVQPAVEGELSSLSSATQWLNSQPLTPAGLRGKVVLIDVWTYTCINWLRTVPYVRAWAEKYKDHGLVVIGVHAPEFPFERNIDNVRRAVKDMGLTYPIAIDNDFAIWRAFKNQAWPALFFVDAQGRTRHHTSAKATTNGRNGSSSNCSPRPELGVWLRTWFRSMPAVLKLPPIGRA